MSYELSNHIKDLSPLPYIGMGLILLKMKKNTKYTFSSLKFYLYIKQKNKSVIARIVCIKILANIYIIYLYHIEEISWSIDVWSRLSACHTKCPNAQTAVRMHHHTTSNKKVILLLKLLSLLCIKHKLNHFEWWYVNNNVTWVDIARMAFISLIHTVGDKYNAI